MDMLCAMSSVKSPSIEIRSRHPSSPRSSAQYPDLDSPLSGSGPRCWDEQLQNISEGLQLICGSPMFSPKSPTALASSSDSPNASSPNSPSSPLCAVDEVSASFVKQEVRRATSVNNPVINPSRRPMTVRHIETSKQLTQQLSIICGIKPGSLDGDDGSSVNADDVESSSAQGDSSSSSSGATSLTSEIGEKDPVAAPPQPQPPVSYRAAALMAAGAARLRLKVDVRSALFEDLIVSVGERNILTARTTHHGCSKTLLRTLLPDTVEINRLLCYVHGHMLLIHERPEERAKITFVGTSTAYLPVVRENEIRKELTIVLHVPDLFEFKNLNVKTVDDTVIFSGVREAKSRSAPMKSGVFSFNAAALESAAPLPPQQSFQVTVPLPQGVDSRSVTACLAKHNQIVVKGRLCPTSRSCTM